MANNKRFEARRRMRHEHSILGVLGFFLVSSAVVFGGSSSLLTLTAVGEGAQPTVEAAASAASPEKIAAAPTMAPAAPVLAPPAPTPAPAWQVVGSASIPQADVAAQVGLVINDRNGDILAAKNADQILPMASITKLMTAWVTLDRASMDKEITISAKAAATPPTNMPLGEGEKLTVRELLYCLLLTSANDSAQALADGLGGEADFVAAMNAKAQDLGLKGTHYMNPTGFDAPGHHSTAIDLANLSHHLFAAHPELLGMIQQPEVSLPQTATHRPYYVANFHPLVKTYPGFLGGKPGFTGEAGNCLLTLAERDGKRVIAVVLNSPDSAGESARLLDFGFSQL